ncbi:DNA polymerase III subunit delta' [Glaciecola punicea ACAM 611]|jgi:DNA polymerase-3 subunit delta'|uniref:DNA-directed DNA polymerase n=1 Tax=Glaciecola punicea ACAM 611 TaxID=1121923 RepID=H5T9W4_9ALTE|nr:DNA polymerase III subunit delta' [Glaciecola punicea]OFA33382.1 DNA polymerase III subunit delta' [Glaciecola punicea]GAB55091.1 DNA polymerase III subunit delta' [Glaciecola punicea ACAM 611]
MYPWLASTLAQLKQRLGQQLLHHGLLFIADKGVGEHQLIDQLVKSLLCATKEACGTCKACKLFEAKSHPDMHYVVSDKPSIGVDLIRQVSQFVTTTSQMLGNKVVIIENIDLMTEAASNSLLKTLEEPSQNTYILLTTTKPNSLLATITSRCEKIRLILPCTDDSMMWLASQTESPLSKEGLLAFSGSAIDYLSSMNNDGVNYGLFCDDLESLLQGRTNELLLAEKNKAHASLVLLWTYQKAVLIYKKQMEDVSKLPANNAISNLQRTQYAECLVFDCQQANKKIAQAGINKSLILQQIFHKFKQVSLIH